MTSPQRPTSMPNTPWRTFQEEPPAKSGSFGMLGGLAIAVGLGALGAYMLDLHGHSCDRCGQRWRHFGAFNLGDEQSHTCSRCGEVQWWKCGAPHVLRGSQYVTPPTTSPVTAPAYAPAGVAPFAFAPASAGVAPFTIAPTYVPPQPRGLPVAPAASPMAIAVRSKERRQ